MQISLIVATDESNGIGIHGDQPAFISEDLKRFKALTSGNTIVMGRKTFQALPKGALPNRRNIVLTRQKDFSAPGCDTIHKPEDLYNICQEGERIFIIGGGEIYRLFFSQAKEIFMTKIHHNFKDIDTWFPEINPTEWEINETTGPYTDKKNGLTYSYINYTRR